MKTSSFHFYLPMLLALCGCRQQVLVSSSMAPTIRPGEQFIVDYTAYTIAAPKRWDVVVFEPPPKTNQLWVMRVAGLPGEQVDFRNGMLLINNATLALPTYVTNVQYLPPDSSNGNSIILSFPYTIPGNSYFLLGDNSTVALDSRFWGAVSKTSIVGKVKGK